MVTMAKGLASGYARVGALIASDRIAQAFIQQDEVFEHGFTFGGHPLASAIAWENIDIFEREDLCGDVREHEHDFQSVLSRLGDIPIVGEIRGDGYFWGIELVRDSEAAHASPPTKGGGSWHGCGPPPPARPDLPGGRPGGAGDTAGPAVRCRPGRVRRDGIDPPVDLREAADQMVGALV